ncbi:UNVERIFIED_CONTAM: hypothetical protein FKN15_073411 [Acipenser sinensis]
MSSLKRQSSWQEDIAKNFSRLFSRTKSEDDGKLGGKTAEIINSSENKENEIISPSETKAEPLSEELQADLSQGGLKVQKPLDPKVSRVKAVMKVFLTLRRTNKIVLYEFACFTGQSKEVTDNVHNVSALKGLIGVGSLRVIGGVWVAYRQKHFCGEQYILEKGVYKSMSDWGGSDSTILSIRPIRLDFSEPSISLFSLDSFEGKELVVEESDISLLNKNFFSQSVRVTSGLWVVYEYASFKGRQMLLTGGEFRCWSDYSGWNTIGSLQPLPQPKVYIRLKNRALGTFLTAEDNVEKSKPSRVSVCPSNGKSTQIWTFSQGLLKSKVNKTCMALIGGKSTAGANVALWPEHGRIHQRWRFNKDSTITSYLNASLVLDVKGTARHTLEHLKPAWRFFDATFNEVFEGLSVVTNI